MNARVIPSLSSMFGLKIAKKFANFLPNFAKLFVKITLEFVDLKCRFLSEFHEILQVESMKIIRYLRKIVKNIVTICEI